MTPASPTCSYNNTPINDVDILALAEKFGIPLELLQDTLEWSAQFLREMRANKVAKASNKARIQQLVKAVSNAINILSDERVQVRLVCAAGRKNLPSDDDERLAHYKTYCDVRAKIDRSITAMGELHELAEIGYTYKIPPGRPTNEIGQAAILPLFRLWTYELGREPKVSGHGNDPRKVKPSRLLEFVHQSMRLLGEGITKQECRSILLKLCKIPRENIIDPFLY
jgi:hypothetical protein